MTFIEACELIADVKDNYKVIYPSLLSRQNFSFKFERLGRQYDAFELIYFYYRDVMSILPPHDNHSLSSRIKATTLELKTALILMNLSNGAWKKMPPFMVEEYDEHRRTFEGITGIRIA